MTIRVLRLEPQIQCEEECILTWHYITNHKPLFIRVQKAVQSVANFVSLEIFHVLLQWNYENGFINDAKPTHLPRIGVIGSVVYGGRSVGVFTGQALSHSSEHEVFICECDVSFSGHWRTLKCGRWGTLRCFCNRDGSDCFWPLS